MKQNYTTSSLVGFNNKTVITLLILVFSTLITHNSFALVSKVFTTAGSFTVASNWTPSGVPLITDVLTFSANCTVDNGTPSVAYGNMTIAAGKTISWPVGGTASLNVANVSAGGAGAVINMTNGGTLIITGTWTSTNLTFTPGTGTVDIRNTMTPPTAYPTYNNLIISTNLLAPTVTIGVNTTINGNLTVTTGTLVIPAFTFSVTGTATVTSRMNITSTTGTKTFGNLTIAGLFSNTANEDITINGNMVNNGTFTQGTGIVTFTGATSNTITGSSTSAFGGGIILNKGSGGAGTTTDQANVLDVQSLITIPNGGLTLTRGTFELTSASTIVPFLSTSTTPVIPTKCKLWCNGGTINQTEDFDWDCDGYLKVSAGTINFGFAISNRIIPTTTATANTGVVEVTGGALNATGRISNGTTAWTYNQSGGTVTLGTIGNTVGGKDVFNMDNATSCVFTMTGGTMIIQNKGGSAGENLGYHNTSALGGGFTGGTLQMGNASTAAGTTMRIETSIPIYNLTINSTSVTAVLVTPATPTVSSVTITNNLDIANGIFDQGTGNGAGVGALDLFVGGNWSNESTNADPFVQGTKTVTFNGTAAQTITNTGDADGTVFNNVTLNNSTSPQTSANITLSGQMSVGGTLTPTDGYLVTSSTNMLTMLNASTAVIGSANSFVNGPMNFNMNLASSRVLTFPIGKSSDWRPAVLTAVNTTTATAVYNAEVFNTSAASLGYTLPATVDTVSQVHYWDINRYSAYTVTSGSVTATTYTANISGNQTIQLYFGTNDNVKDGAKLTVCKNVNGGSAWVDIGGTGAPAYSLGADLSGSISSTSAPTAPSSFTSFSRFTLGSLKTGWNPLPIELLEFTATPCNSNVCLEWLTASERSNDYFTIEKSKDGVSFEYVTKVKGAGNSTTLLKYTATDTNPYQGVSYYRLKQTDFDGHVTYSSLQMVEFNSNSTTELSLHVFPNPSDGLNINYVINAEKGKEILVVVYDVTGREAYSKVIVTDRKGENVFALDPSGKLPSGLYLITATSDNSVYSKRLIVN